MLTVDNEADTIAFFSAAEEEENKENENEGETKEFVCFSSEEVSFSSEGNSPLPVALNTAMAYGIFLPVFSPPPEALI